MEDCIFCKIIAGDIPADILYADDEVVAFRDANPVAPTHILIVPVEHIITVNEFSDDNCTLPGKMMNIAKQLSEDEGVEKDGYRLVINNGENGGQIVKHLHMHLIGGRKLSQNLD